jgi:hypothetical protein
VKLHDAWLRWHCGAHPLRVVTSKMLPKTPSGVNPAERERQCGLRRKFKGVFDIIQGQTTNSVVDMDVEYVWDVCWNRTVILFRIPLPCNWVVSTAFDFFHRSPLLAEQAKGTPSVAVSEAALAAAARSAKIAEDARNFALAATSQAPVPHRASVAPQMPPSADAPIPFTTEAAAAVALALAIQAAGAPSSVPPPLPSPSLAAAPPRAAPAASPRHRAFIPVASPAPAHDPFVDPPQNLQLNPHWPAPNNLWMPGAEQCALCCTTCRIGAWQSSHRGMLNHYRAVHHSVCQLPLRLANVSGPDNVVVTESCWCIRGLNADGTAITNKTVSFTPCKRRRE